MEPKEISSRLIPRPLVVFTRLLEILATTLWDTCSSQVDCLWKPEKEPKMNIAMVAAAMVTEEITALFLLASYRL